MEDPETTIHLKSVVGYTRKHAVSLNEQDPLKHIRDEFIIPTKRGIHSESLAEIGLSYMLSNNTTIFWNWSSLDVERNGSSHDTSVYLCGNSLGIQPRRTRDYVDKYLNTWASQGVHGHFKQIKDSPLAPWLDVDEDAAKKLAPLVGAFPHEVAVMQTLTANIHILMCSFYKPTKERYKIMMESKAFPSDHVSPPFHLP